MSYGSDLWWDCDHPGCGYGIEVVGRDVSARLEIDRMREGHKAWHRMVAAEAHGVDA